MKLPLLMSIEEAAEALGNTAKEVKELVSLRFLAGLKDPRGRGPLRVLGASVATLAVAREVTQRRLQLARRDSRSRAVDPSVKLSGYDYEGRARRHYAFMDLSREEWRSVPGFPGVQASDAGRVRALHGATRRKSKGRHPGIVLVPRVHASGVVRWRGRFVDPHDSEGRFRYVTLPVDAQLNEETRATWARVEAARLGLQAFHTRALTFTRGGYVSARVSAEGQPLRRHFVHRLVLLAFIGPRGPGDTASHINGIPWDNRPGNLVWESLRANVQRGRWHSPKPERTGNLVLPWATVE